MFKFIVVCAFFAAAAAKPGALLYQAPITQYSTFVEPATTTITKQDLSVIHPSPVNYYTPLAYTHFIKKRSPQWASSYVVADSPARIEQSPALIPHGVYVWPAVGSPAANIHLIKKRSAPLLPAATYIAPSTYAAAGAPILTTSYAASTPLITPQLYPSSPLITQAFPYAQFIKK